jgi:hypothetical protein
MKKIKIRIVEGYDCGCPDMMPQKDHDHGEGKMHRTSLMDTMKSAAMLLQIIQDEDDLPEWVESKITKATDYLSSVRRYLQGEEARTAGQLEEAEDVEMEPEEVQALMQKIGEEDPEELARLASLAELPTEMSEGLLYHLTNQTPINENIYRHGSDEYFNLVKEVRTLSKLGVYTLSEEEKVFLDENPDLGEWGIYEGERVPLDFPLYENASQQLLDEKRKKKKKKDPPIGKPMKNTGSGKKYKVFVRSKTGRVKKITYGDSKGGLKGNWNNPEARKSFASRHDCENKKDRTKAGYWACRAHKDFGTNVSGRFW